MKKHEHVLQNNTVLKELFPSNSITVANKRGNNLQKLIPWVDPYNIKTNLLGQTPYGYKKCGVNLTYVITSFWKKHLIYVLPQGLNLEFVEIVPVTPKTLYI